MRNTTIEITVKCEIRGMIIEATGEFVDIDEVKEALIEEYQSQTIKDDDTDEPELDKDSIDEGDIEIIDFGDASSCDYINDLETIFEVNGSSCTSDIEVIDAGLKAGVDIDNIDEAYQGEYKSDADFAEETAEQLGYLDGKNSWPHNCIDWDQAAKDLMMDYCEENGYYFRNM